jgi:hypothetical protein
MPTASVALPDTGATPAIGSKVARPKRSLALAIPVAVLLLLYWSLAVSAVRDKCATYDEGHFLAGGYCFWAFNDYRFASFEGPLPQRWAALPLLWNKPECPHVHDPNIYNSFQFGHDFLFRVGNDPDQLLRHTRPAAALLSTSLGLLIFLWSKRLFGYPGGLISLVLFTFCPTMLANGPLLKADMASALFFTASTGCLWRVLERVTFGRTAASCLILAGLFLSKLTAPLIVVIAAALVFVRLLSRRPLPVDMGWRGDIGSRFKQGLLFAALAVVHFLAVWGVVWAAYGFRYSALNQPPEAVAQMYATDFDYRLSKAGRAAPMLRWLHDARLLPEACVYGLTFQTAAVQTGYPAFLNGEFRAAGGFPGFFPYCWMYKNPLALFGVLALAVWGLLLDWRRPSNQQQTGETTCDRLPTLYDLSPLLVLLAAHWTAVLSAGLDVGHRYLVPTYPAVYILAGAGAVWFRSLSREQSNSRLGWLASATLVVLLSAFATESLLTWPNFLAYFNPLAGGPRHGYRHLVDSSLDWGQDLPGLRKWLEANVRSEQDAVYLAYFGTANVSHYGIRANNLTSEPPKSYGTWAPLRGGIYCISASMLQMDTQGPWDEERDRELQEYSRFATRYGETQNTPDGRAKLSKLAPPERWPEILQRFELLVFRKLCVALRGREPDDQVGYSILIYRLSDQDVARALLAPPETRVRPRRAEEKKVSRSAAAASGAASSDSIRSRRSRGLEAIPGAFASYGGRRG